MAIKLSEITERIKTRLNLEGSPDIQDKQIWSIVHAELKDLQTALLAYTTFYGEAHIKNITTVGYPPGISPAVYTEYHVDLNSVNYKKLSKVTNISTGKPIPQTPTESALDGWANSSQYENEIFYFEYGKRLVFRKGSKVDSFPSHVFIWLHRLPTEATTDDNVLDMPDEWEAPIIDNAVKHVLRKIGQRDMSVDVNRDAAESIANLRAGAQEAMLLMEGAKKAK